MKAKEVVDIMNNWAKPELIDEWDNTGFQIGDGEKEISKILIALDLSKEVCEKAIEEGFHMIITHHPLIFKPLKSITTCDYKERLVYNLIKNDIAVYNAHTNLDRADGGVNHELGRLLGLMETLPLKALSLEEIFYGYGRVGNIEEIYLASYISTIKEALDIERLIVYGRQDRKINRVAVCGGSGSDFIYDAYKSGADLYITGDIKYHDAQTADELGLTLIDAGHFHTEKIILPVIKTYLESHIKEDIYIEIHDKPSPLYSMV